LWLAYQKVVNGTHRVVVRRRSSAGAWGSEIVLGDSRITQQPTLAFYRGRIHVAANYTPASQSEREIGYASCSLPCSDPSYFTRWVIQEGGGSYNISFAIGDTSAADLFLLHRPVNSASDIYWRSKDSE
jgi:hypothetical protein